MKALLVNVDLMARVVVPDNATDEQILEATIERITYLVNQDRYFVSEGVTKWVDDTEVPYGESPSDGIPEASPEFIELAKLLVEMMVESDSDMHIAFQDAAQELEIESYKPELEDMAIGDIPEDVIKRTAYELECGFQNAQFDKTEGGYYYSGMTEDYGGFIEKAMINRAKEILISNKTI